MGSLLNPGDREEILGRLSRLKPDARPLWGRFTPGAMICHVTTGVGQGLGEVQLDPPSGPFTRWPLNWLAIHVAPWPKGKTQSPPEFLAVKPTTWEEDLARLSALVGRFGDRKPEDAWPVSPFFGRISGRSWGVLQYRHLDHHLTQFGA